jgi:hypothetical protein
MAICDFLSTRQPGWVSCCHFCARVGTGRSTRVRLASLIALPDCEVSCGPVAWQEIVSPVVMWIGPWVTPTWTLWLLSPKLMWLDRACAMTKRNAFTASRGHRRARRELLSEGYVMDAG